MNEIDSTTIKIALIAILLSFLLILAMVFSSGCVTAAKNTYHGIIDTPTPTPTPNITPTPEPTEAPIVYITEDPREYMLRTNGYEMREWVQWFRPNVEGINRSMDTGDLHTAVTVYGYKFLPSYHYYSVSWARPFLVKPERKDDQFLFVFINMYSDGDDVRQYGIDYNHFAVQIGDRLYNPDFFDYPERRIIEFDEVQNFARTESIKPYGYRIVQEKGSGIISAQKDEWLMGGRSNAWDGYIIYQVPYNATANETKVIGSFANLAPQSWWQLK